MDCVCFSSPVAVGVAHCCILNSVSVKGQHAPEVRTFCVYSSDFVWSSDENEFALYVSISCLACLDVCVLALTAHKIQYCSLQIPIGTHYC